MHFLHCYLSLFTSLSTNHSYCKIKGWSTAYFGDWRDLLYKVDKGLPTTRERLPSKAVHQANNDHWIVPTVSYQPQTQYPLYIIDSTLHPCKISYSNHQLSLHDCCWCDAAKFQSPQPANFFGPWEPNMWSIRSFSPSIKDYSKNTISNTCCKLIILSTLFDSLSNGDNNRFMFHQSYFLNWQKPKTCFQLKAQFSRNWLPTIAMLFDKLHS